MEDLKINPCYEGVLRYLVEKALEKENETDDISALLDAPACLQRMVYDDNDTIHILSCWLLDWADKNKKPHDAQLSSVRELRDVTEQMLRRFEKLFDK